MPLEPVNSQKIPVRNLYYLLCYAWNRLAEGEIVDVSAVDTNELADLFATVLISGVNHLSRRGLDKGYRLHQEELASVRGRIQVDVTARRLLMQQGRIQCEYDEFTVNTLPNQIIKSTLAFLARVPSLNKSLKAKLQKMCREFHGAETIPLNKYIFRRVQLNTNNRFYRFLLNVCEITIASWLVDERTGRYHFRDFVRDDNAMGRLYENFILNFYKIHLKNASVKKEKIKWNASSATDPELKYLPSMETDISIRYAQRCLIIDAKFYSKTLQTYYDKESIHSANLYQIFSYLENLRSRGGGDENAEGMLLYPAIDKRIRETYNLGKRRIHICTLDLNAEWRYIHRELLDIPKAFEI